MGGELTSRDHVMSSILLSRRGGIEVVTRESKYANGVWRDRERSAPANCRVETPFLHDGCRIWVLWETLTWKRSR